MVDNCAMFIYDLVLQCSESPLWPDYFHDIPRSFKQYVFFVYILSILSNCELKEIAPPLSSPLSHYLRGVIHRQ